MGRELSADDQKRLMEYDKRVLDPDIEPDAYSAETLGIFIEKYENFFHYFFNKIIFPAHQERLLDEARDMYYEKMDRCLVNYKTSFDSTFTTYLGEAIKNSLKDLLRKRRRDLYNISLDWNQEGEMVDAEESLTLLGHVTQETAPADIMHQELSDILDGAIDTLPEKYRNIILLRHKSNLPYDVIAERLDIPLGTVKANIHRGRKLLGKNDIVQREYGIKAA